MNQNTRKRIEEIREAMLEEYLDMMPDAISALRNIIQDPDINPLARVSAIALISDRCMGKAEENIRVQHMEEDMDAAEERLDKVFEEVRKKYQ